MRRGLWVVVIAMLLAVSPAIAQTSVLDRPLSIDALGNPVVWLPASIGDGTFASRIAMSGQLPLIFEPSPLPTTSITRPQRLDLIGKTVREALDLFVAADGRYAWAEVNGVIVIRPIVAITDATDSLNAPVANVVWDTISADQALVAVVGLMSRQSPPSPTDELLDDRAFSIAVPVGSVLDVLIECARSHGALIWSAPNPNGYSPTGLSVTVGTFDGRSVSANLPLSQ